MSLLQTYQQFLASPTTSLLADGAQINYVPTLTTITEPAAILKHFAAQAKLLTKKSEKVINTFESDANLCAELETTIEFIAGGGALCPGLDDNFLADKIVVFPMIHIVQFDHNRNISQVRLYWDQASLLKSLEVIGSRGRNWPIRDGKDQLRLIANSASTEGLVSGTSRRSTISKVSGESRSHAGSVASATGDPHASLSLFQPREVSDETTPQKSRPGIVPRTSAKPPTRNLTDILSGKENENFQPGSPSARPVSPRKNTNGGAPKGGAGKNYHDIRLFDDQPGATSPEKSVKTHPNKYKHFEFGNGEGAVPFNAQKNKSTHASQWSFDDFMTPDKPRPKVRPHDQRHIGWSDDEEAEKSPVLRPVVHHERPDAKPHFAFTDEAGEGETRRPTSRKGNEAMGLYQNNVVDDDDENTPVAQQSKKQPLSTVTNVNHASRHKTFDAQHEMRDESPAGGRGASAAAPVKVDQNRAKVLKGLNPSWGMYDESPETSKKENVYRIGLGGDGMGGRKNSSRHQWGFEDIDEPSQKPQTSRNQQAQQPATSGSNAGKNGGGFWDF